MLDYLVEATDAALPLVPVTKATLPGTLAKLTDAGRAWVETQGFGGEPGAACLVPGADGRPELALAGIDDTDPWAFAALPAKLPAKLIWRIDAALAPRAASWAAQAWALATYSFSRYKSKNGKDWPKLVWPEAADQALVRRTVEAIGLVRDMVNTPAADMGPEDIGRAAEELARRFAAKIRMVAGDRLLEENWPAVHAVGRASAKPPRLIDLRWGDEMHPKVTLVGKGVCFDSGGLDLKPSSNMKLMKKDMGGAAHVLGLALMIMDSGLPVRLRVLIPAVENMVSGDSFRPLDVLQTRKGLTVEVGNTDAEGRLILCDALAEACAEKPDLVIDCATLTGAARTALGPDLPALLSNDDKLAADLLRLGEAELDPMWRLPLWKPYRRMLDSKVADLNNAPDGPYAGAITAGLFLQEFVTDGTPWAHLDLFAWNPSAKPGRPDGGEAYGLRTIYALLNERYG